MKSYFNIHKFYERKAVIDSVFFNIPIIWLIFLVCLAIFYQTAEFFHFKSYIEMVILAGLMVGAIWAILYFVAFIGTFKNK